MTNDEHWARTRISEASKHYPLVSEAVLSKVGQLLEGQLSEQTLSPTILRRIATELIGDMAAKPPTSEAKQ